MARTLDKQLLPQGLFLGSFAKVADMPPTQTEICVIGRSNSGKSSLLSAFFRSDNLVKTSSKPGHTRTVNLFEWQSLHMADLPGYGYAKTSHKQRDTMSAVISGYLTRRQSLKAGLLTHDCRRDLTEIELQLAQSFRESMLPLILVMTKSDKLTQKQKAAIIKKNADLHQQFHQVTFVSSTKLTGFEYLLNFLNSF